jgi:UDP-glucose 4-epimerase
MNILIIGTNGFIGSHVAAHFGKSSGYKVTAINWSPDCLQEIENICQSNTMDVVINATGSADVAKSVKFPAVDFEANVMFHFKLLDILKHGGCKYIYFSSAAVYGNPQKMPIAETDAINAVSPYGWHKYYGEMMCKEFASLYKIQTASLRLFSVFGPGQKKMLFYDLYTKCNSDSPTIELQGSGNDSRDFIYVQDVVLAVEKIITAAPMQGECYNIGSGTERQIKDVAAIFVSLAAPDKKIKFNGHSIPGYPSNWKADMSRMTALVFVAQTDFTQGIKETIQWLKENV